MEQVAEAAIFSWNWEPAVLLPLSFSLWVYRRGWKKLRTLAPSRFPLWRFLCFLGGSVVLFLAICSPLDTFGNLLLQVHMVQHLLLTMIVPPLLLLGFPYLPILLGLPRGLVANVLGPFLSWKILKILGKFLTHPAICCGLFLFSNILWHVPFFYEAALKFPVWHKTEHACFVWTSLLFWWPVIQPWPSRACWPRWTMVPYLLIADLQNTILSAFLSFCDHALYQTYAIAPRIGGISTLEDQAAAGAIMWVPGSIVFLAPVSLIVFQFLSPQRSVIYQPAIVIHKPLPNSPFDLLRAPLVGSLLRRKAVRRFLQVTLLMLAILVMIEGWWGPQFGPMNLAGILPWTHWRGLTVMGLLIAGNFFCMACPFTLTRDLARRILPFQRWSWPKWLRTKWIAVGLLVLFFWAYEAFSLWNSPRLTAGIIAGYFSLVVLIDVLFKNAAFCKYVCPIGQFHFVQSLNSPLQVQARDATVCASCRTYDCIRGSTIEKKRKNRGCELHLFQPHKHGNMDCTFCLDCVYACPKDNVGLVMSPPWKELALDHKRSGVGRYSHRFDLAVLVVVLTFGAFANAMGMVTPVLQLENTIKTLCGITSTLPIVTAFYILALLVLPAITVSLAGWLSLRLGKPQAGWKQIFSQLSMSLVPVGFGMWLSHFLFHFFTASHTFIPAFQRFFSDIGLPLLGTPDWSIRSWAFPGLLGWELLLLDLGLLMGLFVAWERAGLLGLSTSRLGIFLPWGTLILLLYSVGAWILLQPMDMRGTI
ncbi:Putative electron transport protein YccM [Candidatus Xiphinematobacter sp. Idaho Grape]|uniref:cytochrome c oxidase assembly protein n=1 Tax=Candidatus Xiphinematobacter sp. Idaho Grape TaxID=1704307 RepID=UPI00070611B7|nr:cytochrome c oxidase assembly protein [Candidatus Xiphinematobacter sp. Idaho Grape]ALJ56374.1 Putative electron transport protein YccM [Candidatus Xiphinematobacter sp. Idaho Grape]